jgi:UDP-N-acetylglucosamine:LPS N-acetylglucosamine transferase
MVEEAELGGPRLANVIAGLMADPPRLAAMADAMRRFAKPDAAARIAGRVWELAA